MKNDAKTERSNPAHEHENREAEKLEKELETPFGAQKLGDEAYEIVKQELLKKGAHK